MTLAADYDVKLALGATSKKFRLLQRGGAKAWAVRELPPQPNVERGATAREGMPPDRALPFIQEDFAWGVGLKNFTGDIQNPGHVYRYADGFGIDTTEVRIVKHGPAGLSNVGTLAETPIQALLWRDKVWFLTATKLYSWDGTTLTNTFTDAANTHKHMEVHGSRLFIAGDTEYLFSTDGAAFTTRATAADRFLSIGGDQLWRAYDDTKLTNSTDPEAVTPTWGSDVVSDDTINNLFSISGIVGAGTQATIYLVNADRKFVEINKDLRKRRSTNSFKLKSESGTDVWFSDTKDVLRLVATSFEAFDIRPGGPFYGYDDRPVDSPPPGTATIKGIGLDLTAVYIAATRSDEAGKLYIYKGVEIIRGIFSWTPLFRVAVSGSTEFCEVLKMSADAAPIVYYNDGAVVKRFSTQWTTYATDWELHTPFFTATLENWDKMAHKLRATLERETNTKVSASYQRDTDTGWTEWGGVAPANEMDDNGFNEIALGAPVDNKKIRFKYAGNTTNAANKVNLRSFHLESILRPDLKRVFDFTVIADNKGEADFLYTLRTNKTTFLKITDRFGTERTAFVIPSYPIELELTDEVRKAPVRAYQIQAIEV